MSARTFRDVVSDLDTVILLIQNLGIREGVKRIWWDDWNVCTVELHTEDFDEVFGLSSLNVRTFTAHNGLFVRTKKRGIVFQARI